MPEKGNPSDLGADLYAATGPKIVGGGIERPFGKQWKFIDYIEYDTGIIVEPVDPDWGLFVFPRSSISKYNLVLANHVGVIDPGYRDTIKLRFRYLAQPRDFVIFPNSLRIEVNPDKIYGKGDKIGQLYPARRHDFEFLKVNSLNEINLETERGEGGFGSTGK